jgi:phosphatidylethanolamine-binding protein (PEBP) family uncharacterized protein
MEELEIYYNNKKIVNDEFLKPSETQIEPKIKYDFNLNNLYTLVMYDPDAVNGTHVHWLVTNIENNINNGKILLSYKGPAPPAKTGKHRYIFELYKQPDLLNVEPLEERSISINLLKNKINLSNYISKIQFISQNEVGGKNKKTKKRRNNNKKTKRHKRVKFLKI